MSRIGTTRLAFSLILAVSIGGSGLAWALRYDQTPPHASVTAQEQDPFKQDKAHLCDQAHCSVDAANANIDALWQMSRAQDRATGNQYADLAKRLTTLKEQVKDDIAQMNNASVNDWAGLRPLVHHDISTLDDQLQKASSITHIPAPVEEKP